MKIAFLNIYNGVVERGSEVFVHELSKNLGKKHDVWVFQAGSTKESGYKQIQIKGIPKITKQGFFYDLLVLLFTLKCAPYLWKGTFDWIVPINGRWQVIICWIIRSFRGGKILISGHAGVGFDDRFNIEIGKPDVFIALSPKAEHWARNIGLTRIAYIPNGIDREQFNQNVKPAKISLTSPIILCVSALLPYKRIDRLIRAVGKLSKGSLLVIGDGPLREELEGLGRLELKERFQLIRYVSHTELPSYYKIAHVFSLPSQESEAFGLVYLEAMACNVSVVAPDDENRRRIVGDGGLYCDVEDVDVYAETLQKALHANFRDKPRKQAERFSWENIAKQYEEAME